MVRKQKINLISKSMMTKHCILLLFLVIFYNCRNQKKTTENKKSELVLETKTLENKIKNQEIDSRMKVLGYFDNDDNKDTIYYYLDKTKGEPIYNCEIKFGNKKNKNILISTASGYIKLTNCKKGCIQKSEITTGIYSSEEIEKYQYDKEQEKWFIIESINKSREGNTIVNKFEEPWSIDE